MRVRGRKPRLRIAIDVGLADAGLGGLEEYLSLPATQALTDSEKADRIFGITGMRPSVASVRLWDIRRAQSLQEAAS